jgi:hypothetical protein
LNPLTLVRVCEPLGARHVLLEELVELEPLDPRHRLPVHTALNFVVSLVIKSASSEVGMSAAISTCDQGGLSRKLAPRSPALPCERTQYPDGRKTSVRFQARLFAKLARILPGDIQNTGGLNFARPVH